MSPSPWFARLYDFFLAPLEWLGLGRAREKVVGEAGGLVLEVGAGTGLNLPHYRNARRIVATDPEPEMLRRARRRAIASSCPATLLLADAQALPFRDAVFDAIVATCVFCSVADPPAAFRELRRVLKSEGDLLVLEHVRAPSPLIARLQDVLTPAWSRLAGGCHLNRPTLTWLQEAGFVVQETRMSFGGIVVRALLKSADPQWEGPVRPDVLRNRDATSNSTI